MSAYDFHTFGNNPRMTASEEERAQAFAERLRRFAQDIIDGKSIVYTTAAPPGWHETLRIQAPEMNISTAGFSSEVPLREGQARGLARASRKQSTRRTSGVVNGEPSCRSIRT